MKHLESLNEAQKIAATTIEGPLLILAGAGAGKTKTVTQRILHIIHQGVNPAKIMAITFTNKAAKEMRERVMKSIEQDSLLNFPTSSAERPFVSTFHVLGSTILRAHGDKLGISKNFVIFDRDDSKKAVKQAELEVGIQPKEFDPGKILSRISQLKSQGITVESYLADRQREFLAVITGRVWEAYEKQLKKEKALDFDDLLLQPVQLFQKHEDVRALYAEQYQYIHIDEYQDTNHIQYKIGKMLATPKNNICVVGDIDQTIYTWRGADISNILNFERDFPNAKVVLLEQNYRSTKNIIAAANMVIEKNKERRKKTLYTENETGEKISLYGAYDEGDEANFIALKIKELTSKGIPTDQIAVLYRANFQSRILEEACINHGIGYSLLGTRFYDRKEIKDALSYIRAARNPESMSDIARTINVPARGIGKVTVTKVIAGTIDEKIKAKVKPYFDALEEIKINAEKLLPSEAMLFVLQRSGMLDAYKKGGVEEDEERTENLKELVSIASRYDDQGPAGLQKFLDDASLMSDQDELDRKNNGVRLMTVHASKGLEFNYVFVSGLEEGLFPQVREQDAAESGARNSRAEEERRLFYVALTRARIKLYLSFASVRTLFGSLEANIPSSFLTDISQDLVEYEARKNEPPRRAERVIYFD